MFPRLRAEETFVAEVNFATREAKMFLNFGTICFRNMPSFAGAFTFHRFTREKYKQMETQTNGIFLFLAPAL